MKNCELKKMLRNIYRNVLKLLPAKIVMNIQNVRGYHKLINFNNPRYFGEKIQWLKMYGNLEKYESYVDKYKVREYIKDKIGEEYLIPLIGVYDSQDLIQYDELPNQFVLKLNNGSGYNLIVKDKNKINYKKTNKVLKKWLKDNYYKINKEPQYRNIKNKIMCEKYITNCKGLLNDYKFFCFDGEVKYIEVDFDRFEEHKMNFYDVNWNLQTFKKGKYGIYKGENNKPKNFNEMIDICRILSKNFQFVRVDLYNVDGKIYFGELTFTPASGLTPFYPLTKDLEIAELIKLQ
ncbi:MAG: glycosyl transferase [Bacilli bacterium]|nr:glycosyl transferase [Bacilli bacterium]